MLNCDGYEDSMECSQRAAKLKVEQIKRQIAGLKSEGKTRYMKLPCLRC